MLTFRNLVALGLFLFGTTFLWMTASGIYLIVKGFRASPILSATREQSK